MTSPVLTYDTHLRRTLLISVSNQPSQAIVCCNQTHFCKAAKSDTTQSLHTLSEVHSVRYHPTCHCPVVQSAPPRRTGMQLVSVDRGCSWSRATVREDSHGDESTSNALVTVDQLEPTHSLSLISFSILSDPKVVLSWVLWGKGSLFPAAARPLSQQNAYL